MSTEAFITPDVLCWALERRGLPDEDVARRLSVNVERLRTWQDGSGRPTLRQAQALAQKLSIPLGYLFLSQRPSEEFPLPDLRTVGDAPPGTPSPEFFRHQDDEVPRLPDIRIEVVDHSLSSSDLDEFVGDYPGRTGGTVEVHFKWGGPWASGPGVEIAVVVILSSIFPKGFVDEMGRDAYRRVKSFLANVLPSIETAPSENRRGFDSPLAIGFESRRLPLRIEFLLPRGGGDWVSRGPVHVELRLNASGAFPIDIAARTIGGHCARSLRFDVGEGEAGASLEEVVLRQATGLPLDRLERESAASGVMMIPTPGPGRLHAVHGLEAARATPLVSEVTIVTRPGYRFVPLPEGGAYPGFIFARGDAPGEVVEALRRSWRCLRFELEVG